MIAARALLSTEQAARLLDHVIFARIAELVDLPALYDLEAMLAHQIGSLCADREHGRALARALVDRALLRLADTPRRWQTADPAVGRSPALGRGPETIADPGAASTGARDPAAMDRPVPARRARAAGPRPPPVRRAMPRRAL